jgi:predicted DNA-binding protein with PD1-like motif
MNSTSMSRRHWIGAGLATCGYLAAAQCQTLAGETSFLGYTKPGPVTRRGLAPRLQHRVVSTGPDGEKTYAVIFGKGDEVLSGLTELAELENIQAAQISAIGAFQHALFAWFDEDRKAFRNIPVDSQVEACSVLGDIGSVAGQPAVHVHGVVALPSGETRGGHMLEAYVWPTLELFLTAWAEPLVKVHDEATDLALFDLQAHP